VGKNSLIKRITNVSFAAVTFSPLPVHFIPILRTQETRIQPKTLNQPQSLIKFFIFLPGLLRSSPLEKFTAADRPAPKEPLNLEPFQ